MENNEQEWIEAPDGWGNAKEEEEESAAFDLFGSDDKSETFTYDIQLDKNKCKRITLSGFKLDSDETDHSTGATLWQAAPRLADYIIQNSDMLCKGKSVLELGAGLGLCGLVACYMSAKVTLTDGDTKTLKGMRANVKHNCDNDVGDRIQCKQLLWGAPHMNTFLKENGQYDTIIAADVIYTKDSIVPLMQTVACLLEKSGQFVLSRYTKWHSIEDETVIELAKQQGLECTQPSKGIFIFRHSNI